MFFKLFLCVVILGVTYGKPQVRIASKPLFRTQHQETVQTNLPINYQNQAHLDRALVSNSRPVGFVPIIPETPVVPDHPVEEDEEEKLKQAKAAHYSFGTNINDEINDGAFSHQETRNGLSLEGMYSYSDGFFKRTVFYAADENGYRVVKEEIEPIGDGPRFDPKGRADVSTSLIGEYHITGDDIREIRDYNNRLEGKQL